MTATKWWLSEIVFFLLRVGLITIVLAVFVIVLLIIFVLFSAFSLDLHHSS